MGWVWRDEPEDENDVVSRRRSSSGNNSVFGLPDTCSTMKIVKSQCRTEEVEPGKFIRKCEKTEQILKDCIGRPAEVVQTNKEYIEDDVTDEMLRQQPTYLPFNHPDDNPFDFPGLRTDIKSIEHSFFNNMRNVFDAVDEIANGFFGAFGAPNDGYWEASVPSRRRGIPIEDSFSKQPPQKPESSDMGSIDLSELAKDV